MSDKKLTLYWLPHCTTCMKTAQYLAKNGHTIAEFRDIKTEPLSLKEVERLAEMVGGAGELFSRRARKYHSMNLAEREVTTKEMIKLMSEEYTFIKRPVLVSDGKAVAGFTPKSYDSFLNSL